MNQRLQKTAADYAVIAVCPALIILMLTSLTHFLVLCIYQGAFTGRLMYILFLFIVAATLIARIAIEEGRSYASIYALALGLVTFIAINRFVQFSGPLAPLSFVLNTGFILLIWWLADRVTFDCTVIDDAARASGEGLMDSRGLFGGIGSLGARRPAGEAVDTRLDGTSGSSDDATDSRSAPRRRQGHQPGRWVLYLAIAALPLFGLGQLFLPGFDAVQTGALRSLGLYLFATLTLLVTTSFLGLRRYLRQRGTEMPSQVSLAWLGGGAALVAGLLLLAFLLPLPGRAIAGLQLPEWVTSPDDLTANRFGWGQEGTDEGSSDDARTAQGEAADPQSNSENARSTNQQPGGEQGPRTGGASSGAQSGGNSSGQGSQPSGGSEQGQGSQSGDQGSQGQSSGSGNQSSGNQSSGNQSSGNQSSGNQSSGNQSSGNQSSGNQSSGQQSSGNQSSGQQRSGAQGASENSASGERSSGQESNRSDSESGRSGERGESSPENSSQSSEGQQGAQQGERSNRDRNSRSNGSDSQASENTGSSAEESNSASQNSSRRLSGGQQQGRTSQESSTNESPPQSSSPNSSSSSWLPSLIGGLATLLKWIIALILIGLIVIFVLKNRDALTQWWQDLMALFGGRQAEPESEGSAAEATAHTAPPRPFHSFRNPLESGLDPTACVVVTFQAFEAWGREHGVAREQETPSEYLPRLKKILGQQTRIAAHLIDAYNRSVYGDTPAGRSDLKVVEAMWRIMQRPTKTPSNEPEKPPIVESTAR